ncbi:hypothetical protein GGX14DRAFT_363155 [Mycena pura]|uniref:Uncharacterized protein n=1 Tax=Mycena pura TaxID=153505 RepID=A0AAD6VIR9_9AGAR|nr:hypothetical protein GGX14DRAFT_363155 [Mycena pura]
MYTLFLLPLLFHFAGALLNVTVDDTDSSIIYRGAWDPRTAHLSGLDYGGSHRLSTNPAANATFAFSGIAVYYLASRWPYAVSTQLSLDGGPGVTVNLTDPLATPFPGGSESAMYSVAWSATGLANTSHTLFLSMSSGGKFIVVDGFMYAAHPLLLPVCIRRSQ